MVDTVSAQRLIVDIEFPRRPLFRGARRQQPFAPHIRPVHCGAPYGDRDLRSRDPQKGAIGAIGFQTITVVDVATEAPGAAEAMSRFDGI
jgi:hypothetical protein